MKIAFIPFMLLVIPILEIIAFILIGGKIGIFPTLLMIVVTAFLGTLLLRHQGFQLVQEIRQKQAVGEIPGNALVHGFMLLVAGIFLLTPGFITDSVGFLLFVPKIREKIWHFVKSHIHFTTLQTQGFKNDPSNPSNGPTIDLDQSEFGPSDTNSPWRKN